MSTKHEEKALESILRGQTPEKRVMVGYESDKKEPRDKKKEKRNGFMDKFLNNIKTWFEQEEQDY